MQGIYKCLTIILAASGLALGAVPAVAQKAEAPKAETRKAAPAKEAGKQEAAKPAALMDINTASAKQLATLKGVGEVRSKAIVKGRPYKAKDELVEKKIVPQNVYDDIKEKIIAKQK